MDRQRSSGGGPSAELHAVWILVCTNYAPTDQPDGRSSDAQVERPRLWHLAWQAGTNAVSQLPAGVWIENNLLPPHTAGARSVIRTKKRRRRERLGDRRSHRPNSSISQNINPGDVPQSAFALHEDWRCQVPSRLCTSHRLAGSHIQHQIDTSDVLISQAVLCRSGHAAATLEVKDEAGNRAHGLCQLCTHTFQEPWRLGSPSWFLSTSVVSPTRMSKA